MKTGISGSELDAVKSGLEKDLTPLELATDVVGYFGLLISWVLLWSPLPTFVALVIQGDLLPKDILLTTFVMIIIFLVLGLLARIISKAIILRSRLGLVVGALLLFGFAFLLVIPFWHADLPTALLVQLTSIEVVVLLFGITCILRASRRERA